MLEFYKDKKVFITGHTGFKGSWLCKILLMAGAKVKGYALSPMTNPNMFSMLNLENQIESVIGDIRDLDKVKKELNDFSPDIVFHLAAQPIVKTSLENPPYTFEVNMMGTVNILEAIRCCKSVKSFVNITTDKVYFDKNWNKGYRETEILGGSDPYSSSKSCSELITLSYNKSYFDNNQEISVSTARSGNIIGGGDFSPYRIIPDCARAAINGEEIIIRNPQSIRPYQHVLDGLTGYLTLAMKQYNNKAISGNYNFGPNESNCVETQKLVSLFCENWQNIKWTNKQLDNKFLETNYLKLDSSKAKKELGWSTKISIEKSVKLVVDWYKAYSANKNVIELTEMQIKDYYKELQ